MKRNELKLINKNHTNTESGQIPPRELLQIRDRIDLIYQEQKYSFSASKSGPNTYSISLQVRKINKYIYKK
jgi:hypothetical protein